MNNIQKEKIIEILNINKKYRIPHEKKSSFFETMLSKIRDNYTYEEFFALKDVSFNVNKGDFIAFIGKNGSGKTTLLSIISNIIRPTSGNIKVNGRVSPFLSMGIGFHSDLTAKENIYLYGAIMGLSRQYLKKRMRIILEFAGVKRFADSKIKTFSQGMVVRLAFSTLIQTKPDILILDEIFAVGDKDFKPKCEKVFEDFKKENKTVILASHNLDILPKYFDRVYLLDEGKIIKTGTPKEVIDYYQNL